MNDHELDLALADLGATRVQPTAPPTLRLRVGAMPLPVKPRQSWLPPAPKRRFQPMFGVTKFVVAGAMVALFGGFLLSGVVTTPGDDQSPAVGATASATHQTIDDLLPGLDTRQVLPGVLEVIGDGTDHQMERVQTISVDDDGTVWLAASDGIYELGDVERHPRIPGYGAGFLVFAEDGTLWAAAENEPEDCCDGDPPSLFSFDGETWVRHGAVPYGVASVPDPWWPAGYIVDFAVHPDGTVWQVAEDQGDIGYARVQHLGADTWTTYAIGDGLPELGCGVDCGGGWDVEITPDGTVWLGVTQGGLLRFDGTEWHDVRPLGDDVEFGTLSIAINRDGLLWAEVQTMDDFEWGPSRLGGGRHLARFDGEAWQVFYASPTDDPLAAPDGDDRGPSGIEAVGPDGTVWLTDTTSDGEMAGGRFPVSFDGERWQRYPEVLAHWMNDAQYDPTMRLQEMGLWHIAVAPDGTAWANVDATVGRKSHGGVYVITPSAVATTE